MPGQRRRRVRTTGIPGRVVPRARSPAVTDPRRAERIRGRRAAVGAGTRGVTRPRAVPVCGRRGGSPNPSRPSAAVPARRGRGTRRVSARLRAPRTRPSSASLACGSPWRGTEVPRPSPRRRPRPASRTPLRRTPSDRPGPAPTPRHRPCPSLHAPRTLRRHPATRHSRTPVAPPQVPPSPRTAAPRGQPRPPSPSCRPLVRRRLTPREAQPP